MEDVQKTFMDWLDTCPVVEHRSIHGVQEDSATWIYTVDFAVLKEDDDLQPQRGHSYDICKIYNR